MRKDLAGTPCLFTGYLEGEDLAEVFASRNLFLFPSTTDTFGNVVLKVQAAGLPVFVTDSGSTQEKIFPRQDRTHCPRAQRSSLSAGHGGVDCRPGALKGDGPGGPGLCGERSFANAFDHAW
jgi:hypothetical protein